MATLFKFGVEEELKISIPSGSEFVSTNAITGLMAAWQDSVPCLFISGQARSSHVSYGKKVRQVGTQEVNILDIVKPLTKYSSLIKDKRNCFIGYCSSKIN